MALHAFHQTVSNSKVLRLFGTIWDHCWLMVIDHTVFRVLFRIPYEQLKEPLRFGNTLIRVPGERVLPKRKGSFNCSYELQRGQNGKSSAENLRIVD